MKKNMIALIAAGVACVGVASAQDTGEAKGKLTTIAAGSDYLQTAPGTEASLPLNGKMVKVVLTGVPIKGPIPYGNTDTIIQRTQDAVFSTAADAEPDVAPTATVPITLTALNLTGTVPGPSGGQCTVTITLAPTPASTGSLILTKTTNTGGTYTSSINVYFMATFSPIAPNTTCYSPILSAPPCVFKQLKGSWSTVPVAGEFLYTGTYPGVQYNQHTLLPTGFGDFYITKPQTDTAATARHATCEALEAAGTACP